MSRIILSLLLIAVTGGALAFGATKAFFSDTESSVANVFTAGAIDLKIDNESYYNGSLNSGTSWSETDLTKAHTFFNFLDLKPDDYGEDTISLHVDTNDAYLCANLTLTSNNENGQTEPETLVDTTTGPNDGELAQLVNFMWWADDGDNVLERDEHMISSGPIGSLPLGKPYHLALADRDQNIWTGQGGPIPGDTTRYIGKAWCFGSIAALPLPQDNATTRSPADDNNTNQVFGEPEDGGFTCDGTTLGNESQTDTLTADIAFSAVQARHNALFDCPQNCTIVERPENVIADSSFELPELTAPQKWDIYDSPVNGVWNIAWRNDIPPTYGNQTRPNPAHLEIHEGVLGNAFDGDQYSELDSDWGGPNDSGTGEPASITMYQDITTVPGRAYRIKFAFAARPNTLASENRLEVRWDGNVVHDTGNVADPNSGIEWKEISIDVVATGSTTRLEFTDLGNANSLGTFIDGIKLYSSVCE